MTRKDYMYFRVSQEERGIIRVLCKREGVTASALIRDLVRAEAKRQGLPPAGLIHLYDEDGTEKPNQEAS